MMQHITPARRLLPHPARDLSGLLAALLLAVCLLVPASVRADHPSHLLRLLVLDSYHQGYTWTDSIHRGILDELGRSLSEPYDLHVEHMDSKRHSPQVIFPLLRDHYRRKYGGTRFNAILACDDNALQFLLDHGRELFPDAPVIFCGVNSPERAAEAQRRGMTGVTDNKNIAGTIDAILELMPDVENIATVSGSTVTASVLLRQFQGVRDRYADTVDFIPLEGLDKNELGRKLETLPPKTAVLLLSLFATRDGGAFTMQGGVDFVRDHSGLPVFVLNDVYLGSGAVGGDVVSGPVQGAEAVRLAVRVLHGEDPGGIPIVREDTTVRMFDYSTLAAHGINPERLPRDAVLLNEPRSFYQQNKALVWTVLAVILAQCLTIAMLVASRIMRRRAERALQLSEEKYRKFFETANEGIVVADTSHIVLMVNAVFAQMIGYSEEELFGQPIMDFMPPEDLSDQKNQYDKRRRGQSSIYERRFVRKDGAILYTIVSATPMTDSQGAHIGSYGMVTDISELRHAEQELRKAYAEMEQRVVERTEELRETNERLLEEIAIRKQTEREIIRAKEAAEEATRAKSEFLANMSHEIRTPLNAITGMAHLLHLTRLSSAQKDYLDKISLSAHSLLDIINDILDLSKIEAGMMIIENVPFDLSQVIEKVSTIIFPKAHEKKLEFLVQKDPELPDLLVGDPLRLTQILINLCNNAVKFTPEGQILLSLIRLSGDGEAVRLRLSVRDEGIGISPEQRQMLFQPFTQADSSTTRQFGGTGLGLSLCKQLTDLMDGEIGFESALGQGSEFWVELPFICQSEETEHPQLPDELHGLPVLVVDDSLSSQIILQTMLDLFGAEVTTVASGPDALQWLDTCAPDALPRLVIMDWRMPTMNGFEAVERVRQQYDADNPPEIIMISSYEEEELVRKTRAEGYHGPLFKPLSQPLLYRTILEIFGLLDRHENSLDQRQVWEEQLGGREVLLVEDNEINRQMAREILESVGVVVHEAVNGRDALELLENTAVELVLMDMQMPVMDGYEATRRIKAREHLSDLPVVAMTAHALVQDQERTRVAGVSAHISKPFEPADLFRTMAALLSSASRVDAEAVRPATPPSPEPEPAVELPRSLPGIDVQTGLKSCNGKPERYLRFLKMMRENHAHAAQSIDHALRNGNPDEAMDLAHSVKGVSGMLGAMELHEAAVALEEALKHGGDGRPEFATFEERLNLVIRGLAVLA